MRTVLKEIKTGLFFRHMDEWTPQVQDAAGFRDTLAALEFCQRNNLSGVAVVHIFGGGAAQKVVGFHRRSRHAAPPAASVSQVAPDRAVA